MTPDGTQWTTNRRAHDPEVAGSDPAPATIAKPRKSGALLLKSVHSDCALSTSCPCLAHEDRVALASEGSYAELSSRGFLAPDAVAILTAS
jgi:hypothetical protein